MFCDSTIVKRYIGNLDLDGNDLVNHATVNDRLAITEWKIRKIGTRLGYELNESPTTPKTHRDYLFDFLISDAVGTFFLTLLGAHIDPRFIALTMNAMKRVNYIQKLYETGGFMLAFQYDLPNVPLASVNDVTSGLAGWGVNDDANEEHEHVVSLIGGLSAVVYTELVRRGVSIGQPLREEIAQCARQIVTSWVRAICLRSRAFQLTNSDSTAALLDPQAREYEKDGMALFLSLSGGQYDEVLGVAV